MADRMAEMAPYGAGRERLQNLDVGGTDHPSALAIHTNQLVIFRSATDGCEGVCGKSPGGLRASTRSRWL
jgi:hypothetical protein